MRRFESDSTEVKQLLGQIRAGDRNAEARLVDLIYPELREIARRMMLSERSDHTLQPTALVHEAYLRLADRHVHDWQDRAHFLATSAQVMRHVLVDHARKWRADKRAGTERGIDIEKLLVASKCNADCIIEVDRVLTKLAELDARQSRVVELRFFGGLTEQEIADVLDIGTRTVKRDWKMARAWILLEMADYSR